MVCCVEGIHVGIFVYGLVVWLPMTGTLQVVILWSFSFMTAT